MRAEGRPEASERLRTPRGPQAEELKSHPTRVLKPRESRKSNKQCGGQARPLLATSGVAVPAAQGSIPRHTPLHLGPRLRYPEAGRDLAGLL